MFVRSDAQLVLCLLNKCSFSAAASDIGGGLGPAKGFGVVVPVAEPVHDCSRGSFDSVSRVSCPRGVEKAGLGFKILDELRQRATTFRLAQCILPGLSCGGNGV